MPNNIIVLRIIWLIYAIVLLPIYILMRKKYGMLKSAKQKLILSSAFCIVGLMGATIQDFSIYAVLIIFGLLFALAGDYYLIYIEVDTKKFIFGIMCFGITHLLYIAAMSFLSGLTLWECIIAAITYIIAVYAVYNRFNPNLGRTKLPTIIYTIIISFMSVKAMFMLAVSPLSNASQLLFSAGAILFLFSDVFLGINLYIIKKPFLRNLNIITYFVGQLMIASSLFFI